MAERGLGEIFYSYPHNYLDLPLHFSCFGNFLEGFKEVGQFFIFNIPMALFLNKKYRAQDNEQWLPIGYSLQALRDCKKHYAQIEMKTISIVFGVECFHEYWYIRRFIIVNTNH